MRKPYIMVLIALLLSLNSLAASPQGAGAVVMFKNGKPSTDPVPLEQLYLSFFRYQQHLDQAAAFHEKQGKDGRWLSEHFEHELDFSEADINVIRMAATSISEENAQLDAKNKLIVDADRAAWKAGTLPVGTRSPSSLPALRLLDSDKREFVARQIAAMNERLGSKKANVLAVYLRQKFAQSPSVTVPDKQAAMPDATKESPK